MHPLVGYHRDPLPQLRVQVRQAMRLAPLQSTEKIPPQYFTPDSTLPLVCARYGRLRPYLVLLLRPTWLWAAGCSRVAFCLPRDSALIGTGFDYSGDILTGGATFSQRIRDPWSFSEDAQTEKTCGARDASLHDSLRTKLATFGGRPTRLIEIWYPFGTSIRARPPKSWRGVERLVNGHLRPKGNSSMRQISI